MTCVFDSSALLRYLDDLSGADRVQSLIEEHTAGRSTIQMSAIQWGEIAGILLKRHGRDRAVAGLNEIKRLQFDLVPATADRAERAALLRIEFNLPYADAFAAELAASTPGSVLITADFDFKAVADRIAIEFLPTNRPG